VPGAIRHLNPMSEPANQNGNSHPLADLYVAQGHKTISTMGVLWVGVGRFSLTSVPFATKVAATQEEVDEMLRASGKWAAVFPVSLATGIHSGAFWVRNSDYNDQDLQRQFRQHVRRSSKTCHVRPIDWVMLRRKGRACNIDTLIRHGSAFSHAMAQSTTWERFCDTASAMPDLEAWGCFHGEELLAYLIAWVDGGTCEALMLHRSEAATQFRATHLLFYEFTHAVIRRPGISGVTMGREWLPQRLSLAQFKKHAGYQIESMRLAVVLHPAWRPLLGNINTRVALRFLRRLTAGLSAKVDNLEILAAAACTRLESHSAARTRAGRRVRL
jgi:hypothetical protein